MGKNLLLSSLLFAGCATAGAPDGSTDAPTNLEVRGQVGDPTVTHVVATTEKAGQLVRVVSPVVGGSFGLALAPQQPYMLTFVDDEQIGMAKLVGTFRSGELDTVASVGPALLDLGTVHFAAGIASTDLAPQDVVDALGIDGQTAQLLAATDDLASRYANPDIDADGVLDAFQPGVGARLEITADYDLRAGDLVPQLSDLQRGDLSFIYRGGSISAYMPSSFGAFTADTAQVTFDVPFYGVASGALSPAVPAGTPITGSELIMGTEHNFGVYARANHGLPAGEYRFSVPGGDVSFASIRSNTEPAVKPMVRIVMADDCKHEGCAPAGIAFQWMGRVDGRWTPLTDESAAVIHPSAAIQLIQVGDDGTSFHQYQLPAGIASGEIAYADTLYAAVPKTQPIADTRYMSVRFAAPLGMAGDASFQVSQLVVKK